MNKKTFRRFLAFVLVLAMTMSTVVTVNTASAASKKVTKVTVTSKANASTELREGTKITKSLLKKILKVDYTYKSGDKTKKVKNYTGFTSPQIGKTVSGSKMKFTVKVGKKKKSTTVKVNKITGIEVAYTTLILVEGDDISFEAFRDFTKVKVTYQRGSAKTISNYEIDSVKTSADGDFKVTVKYGKYTSTVAVPVISKEPEPTVAPTVKPTVVPTVKPTVVPTVKPTVVPTVKPTVVPTVKPMATPGGNGGGGGGTIIVPKPTVKPTVTPTVKPTVKPTVTPTVKPTATPVPEYTVTVKSSSNTIKFNGSSMDLSSGTATETVKQGTSISLSASDSSSYKFIRWIDSTGKELSTSKTYEFTVSSNTSITAVFETVYTLTVKRVGGKGKVTVGGELLDFYSNKAELSLVPGIYTLSATGTDDYQFVNWTNEKGKVLSASAEYAVNIATSNVTVIANFTEVDKTVMVTYKNDIQILKSEAVAYGETLAPPTSNIWRSDKTFAGWSLNETIYYGDYTDSEFYSDDQEKLSDAIKAITEKKQDVIIVTHYVDNPVQSYTVSLIGGTVNGETSTTVENNTKITVLANTPPSGKYFNYWKDDEDNIISYNESYTFFVSKDISLTAVFGDTRISGEPIVTLDLAEVTDGVGITYRYSCDIPSSYEKLEWGIAISIKLPGYEQTYDFNAVDDLYPTDLVVSNAGYAAKFNAVYFQYHATITAKAYAVIKDSSGTKTIYSANSSVITL